MTHRIERVRELIRRELGPILDRNFHFPGCIATIHEVSLTPDLKQCFVYVGVLGKTEEPELIMKRLNDGRSLIQRDLYKRVKLKNSPTLYFKYDDSVERGVHLVSLIENLPEPLPDELADTAGHLPGDVTGDVAADDEPTPAPRRKRR
jgi:ribosome-binding factor A